MSHAPKFTLTGPRADRGPGCAGDFWGTTLYGGEIEFGSSRENHGDARRPGYENGTLSPPRNLGFRYIVLIIVQWS